MKQIGKKGQKWLKFRKEYLKDKSNFQGYFECTKCHKWITNPEVDHILSRGSHPELVFDKSNLQILCGSCHRHKTDLT